MKTIETVADLINTLAAAPAGQKPLILMYAAGKQQNGPDAMIIQKVVIGPALVENGPQTVGLVVERYNQETALVCKLKEIAPVGAPAAPEAAAEEPANPPKKRGRPKKKAADA